MRHAAAIACALAVGTAAGYLLAAPPRARVSPDAPHDTIAVSFPDPHHPEGRATHTLAVVGSFPVDRIDVRGVHPDDWIVRRFDWSDPQGGTITYARPVTSPP